VEVDIGGYEPIGKESVRPGIMGLVLSIWENDEGRERDGAGRRTFDEVGVTGVCERLKA
jgi:hypothetical protein